MSEQEGQVFFLGYCPDGCCHGSRVCSTVQRLIGETRRRATICPDWAGVQNQYLRSLAQGMKSIVLMLDTQEMMTGQWRRVLLSEKRGEGFPEWVVSGMRKGSLEVVLFSNSAPSSALVSGMVQTFDPRNGDREAPVRRPRDKHRGGVNRPKHYRGFRGLGHVLG